MDGLPGEETGDREQTKWPSLTTQEGPRGVTQEQGLGEGAPRVWN